MATIHQIFNRLVENPGKEIQVRNKDKQAHENLRIRLVKLFSKHKSVLDSLGAADDSASKSLCADYQEDSGLSSFRIGNRRNSELTDFQIVEDSEDDNALASG